MGVTPIQLDKAAGDRLVASRSDVFSNTILESSLPQFTPSSGSVSFINRGGYVAKYTLKYNSKGKESTYNSPNITAGRRDVVQLPLDATNIRASGQLFTGVFTETKDIFNQTIKPTSNTCITTTGSVFQPATNSSCN
jgi:hypothetical protein